ncbi:hypothetical protein [Arthrobacter methylotrophus]|uniref:hypothetical protein n=1 Tax=Arthrobacter methylotrophus TaxID=121291 RepID=UPI0031EBFA8A
MIRPQHVHRKGSAQHIVRTAPRRALEQAPNDTLRPTSVKAYVSVLSSDQFKRANKPRLSPAFCSIESPTPTLACSRRTSPDVGAASVAAPRAIASSKRPMRARLRQRAGHLPLLAEQCVALFQFEHVAVVL